MVETCKKETNKEALRHDNSVGFLFGVESMDGPEMDLEINVRDFDHF